MIDITIIPKKHKLIKVRGELPGLNHCAALFLSRAATYLCCYYTLMKDLQQNHVHMAPNV